MGVEMKRNVFLGLLIPLVGLGIYVIVCAVIAPGYGVINYISGLAMIVIATLTLAHVYVTSRQLNVMDKQLEQIEIERRLQNQPLPYISNIDVSMERPRFYFSPPEDEYRTQSRYWAKLRIRNIGNHPAVCIDVSMRIEIHVGDEKRYFSTTSINIPAIGDKEDYPIKEGEQNVFVFAGDKEGLLVQALREQRIDKLPLLNCRILFRNIMGGCFILSCQYRLYPKKEEDDSLFSEWLSAMKSFGIKYKNDIEGLGRLRKSNKDKWKEEFDKLKVSFSESIGVEDIELSPWLMPGSFAIKSITLGEYEREIADVAYGVKI